jgi:nitrite reductase/ring-hydroxylating ferredoxin subunit
MDAAFDVIGTRPLRRAAYTDAGQFHTEREKVFAGGWTALLFAHQLPDPGDQVPVEAAGLPLVAVRDRHNNVRVFHNVCRHRASLVVPTAVKAQPTLRCPYHGWAYGLDGALRATPLWDGQRVPNPAALDRTRLGLRQVRCGVWSDVVWIDLSGTAPPLEDHVAPLTSLWQGYDMDHAAAGPLRNRTDRGKLEAGDRSVDRELPRAVRARKTAGAAGHGTAHVHRSGGGCDVRLRDGGGRGVAQWHTVGAVARSDSETHR